MAKRHSLGNTLHRERMVAQVCCYSHQLSREDIMSDTERVWELMKKIGICMWTVLSTSGTEVRGNQLLI
jgi:hypothetical protein